MTAVEIKAIIKLHLDYGSEAMNIKYNSGNTHLKRYKRLIDENPIIKEIVSPIKEQSYNSISLFEENDGDLTVHDAINEIEDLAIKYKELTYLVDNDVDLTSYAIKLFLYKISSRKYVDYINELFRACLLPLYLYIKRKLEEKLYECQEQEKEPNVVHGDYVKGIMQKDNNKAVVKNVDKSKHKFEFNKSSFFLGIVGTVVAELIVWCLLELIQGFIK